MAIKKIKNEKLKMKNYNSKFKIRKLSHFPFPTSHFGKGIRAFTLVELLVAVAILATVGVMAANMFFQTLKGASKAEVEKRVKQEGEYTISVMEKMIRNAKRIEEFFAENPSWRCDGSNRPDVKITNQDNGQTIFSCVVDGSDKYIASSSGGLRARLTSNKIVVSTDCNFIKCTRTGSALLVVEIKFSLSPIGSPTRPEEKASVDFQTTVSLRNY